MASRLFAVLAAAFLVVAIGMAAVLPPLMSLERGLSLLDRASLDWARLHAAPWLWNWFAIPLLGRPLWLIPASVGVICAGIATSVNFGKTPNTRRRRS